MGRRILAFFLGFLLGIIFVFGALAGAVYVAVTTVRPSDFYPGSDKLLGDLADMSIMDIYQSITDLYMQKIGIRDANGLYFTLEQFCEHYNINPSDLFGGKEVPQEVLDLPIFEMFGGDSADAMEQVKVSAVFAFINMLTSGEDGRGLFSQDLVDKLSMHSMAEFADSDKGFTYIFSEVLICDVLPGMFPPHRTDDNTILWALGQSSIGKLLGGMGGNLLLQFKPEGAFETMGSLKFKELLGESSTILNAIFKNYTLSDVIDDTGGINPDAMLQDTYIGDLIGYQRNQLIGDVLQYYEEFLLSSDGDKAVLRAVDGSEKYVLRLSAVGDVEYEYYEATLPCSIQEHEHVEDCGEADENGDYLCGQTAHSHDVNCFAFIWYLQTPATTELDDDLIKDGVHYNRATGLYTAIADATIGDLMSGDTQRLVDKLLDVQLGDIIEGQETADVFQNMKDMTLRELMKNGIDQIYYGTIFGYVRKEITPDDDYVALGSSDDLMINGEGEVIKKEGEKWYLAQLHCDEEPHTHSTDCYDGSVVICGKEEHHDASCYNFVWFENDSYVKRCEGIKGLLAGTTIGGLMDINSTILGLTLIDVLGEDGLPSMLKNLGHTKIGKLSEEIEKMRLGEFLGYARKPLPDVEGVGKELTKDNGEIGYYVIENGSTVALSTDNVNWYLGKMICSNDNAGHKHAAKCYSFVWYENEDYVKEVEGMMGKLANETIYDLANISDTIMGFTLSDVMGDKVPSILNSIKDKQIGELDTAIDQMYLGDFLSYHRDQIANIGEEYSDCGIEGVKKHASSDVYIRQDDDGDWYVAKYDCAKSDGHSHDATCYPFVWYKCEATNEAHAHGDDCIATGVMGKLANERISNLGNLNDTIKSFTLYDVMGDDVPSMLKSIQNTPISELNDALESMYLGDLLGYNRITPDDLSAYEGSGIDGIKRLVDDETGATLYVKLDKDGNFYSAKLDCYVDVHEEASQHDETCYKYIWYSLTTDEVGLESYVEETGIMSKFANLTVGGMKSDTIQDVINNTTLGEVIPDAANNKILAELSDVKISHLSSEINSVYVGTAMGYVREEADVTDVTLTPVLENIYQDSETGKYYFYDTHKKKYYNAQLNCVKKVDEEHVEHVDGCYDSEKGDYTCGYHVHDAICYGFIWYSCDHEMGTTHEEDCKVTGLNGKMSSLTLDDLSGNKLNAILRSLTVDDLIDSGMLNEPSEKNLYVYAIIFCDHENCTLGGYLISRQSTKDYWLGTHGYTDAEESVYAAHRDEWRDKPLSVFMTTLLDAISNFSLPSYDY